MTVIISFAMSLFTLLCFHSWLAARREYREREELYREAREAWRLHAMTAERLRLQERYGEWQEWRWQ